jgi:TolB-like protein
VSSTALTVKRFLFGTFLLDPRAGLFLVDECGARAPQKIGSRALGVLSALVERHGELVSKEEIMNAVWPGVAVEDGNLTVQIAALRRLLDRQHSARSCIQTVPARGYRFVEPVRILGEGSDAASAVQRDARERGPIQHAPRLSLVVLPFQNLSGNRKDDYLGDAITDDLTGELSRVPDTFVTARASAYACQRIAGDVRQIGEQLGVRYIIQGSVRRIGRILRVNVQLVLAETGANLWADRFDVKIGDLAASQEAIVNRIRSSLAIEMIDAEVINSSRQQLANQDALNLVLRARSLLNQPFSVQRNEAARVLYEQALASDPTSLRAIVGLVRVLVAQFQDLLYWLDSDSPQRVVDLLAQAQAIAPHDEEVLTCTIRLLEVREEWHQLMVAAQNLIDRHPNSVHGYLYLARGKIATGAAEEALPLLARTIDLNPRDQYLWDRYWRIGFALQLIGRDEESIVWHRRAMSVYPDAPPLFRSQRLRSMASAWALSGHVEEARDAITKANRIWPFATVRTLSPINPSSKELVAQMRRFQEGLRIAGLRDHADEDADFGVAPENVPRQDLVGLTPKTVPGAVTIRTVELQAVLARECPVIVDTGFCSWGRSIPGAVGLKFAGTGSWTDATQTRFRHKMHEIAGVNVVRPIIAIGCNSERFDGYNLALRLVALGCKSVYWYRGGREAWEVNSLPDSEIDMQDWYFFVVSP